MTFLTGSIYEELAPIQRAFNHELRAFVESYLSGPAELDLMLRYHLGWVDADGQEQTAYSGKQIRPLLVLLSTKLFGGQLDTAMPAAIAVELLHNFSLIHDDIEDQSPYRRGRPTLWRIWGLPLAINAGDAMFVMAHAALYELVKRGLEVELVSRAWDVFLRTNAALTRGQHLDMWFEKMDLVTVEQYLSMIEGKSAALIACAMELGAILAGCEDEGWCRKAGQFGTNLGILFQIQDDILGIWGDPERTGKSVATDLLSRKKSLPVLYALKHSEAFARRFAEPFDEESVGELVSLMDLVGTKEFAEGEVERYSRSVRGFIRDFEVLGSSEGVSLLQGLIEQLFGRLI